MRYPRRHHRADETVEALLRDVSALRLTMDTDLTVAAAAADADRFDLAAEILEFDRAELAAFTKAARATLNAPAGDLQAERPAEPGWRQRLAFAAGPAVLAAAALIAVVAVTNDTTSQTPQASAPQRLVASYSALTQLANANDDPAALLAVGGELNRSLEQLIAAAAHDPAKARQAMRILQAEQQLLIAHHPNGAAQLLAQAAALVHRLQQTVPAAVLKNVPAPVARPSAPNLITGLLPKTGPSPAQVPKPTTTAAATPSPAPAKPSQEPAPQPSSGEATVSPEPTAQPTFDPWPFDNGLSNNR